MSFRARIALVSATAVALAVVIASIVVYFVVRGQLLSSLDGSIRERTTLVLSDPGRAFFAPGPFGVQGYVQVVGANGACQAKGNQACLVPVTRDAREVARGEKEAYFSAANASDPDHTHLRILTIHVPGTSAAVQVARPLTEVDHSLSRIRWYLILIAVGGAAVAAGLGLLVSRAALAPVRRLTGATERVAETGDLSERIDAHGEDELSRLAGSFNTMLGALDESRRVQRQLVEDASHELRTPLTSLRTNIEVLASERTLPPGDRERLLSDVVEQLQEMTLLVGDLIEVARGEQHGVEPEDVRLDLVAAEAVERAQRNRPGRDVHLRSGGDRSFAASPRRSSAQSGTCSTTRPSGARPAARSSWPSRTGRSSCAITALGSPTRTCRMCSSASIAPSRRAGCPDRGSDWRSCARSPTRTGERSSSRAPTAAGRSPR